VALTLRGPLVRLSVMVFAMVLLGSGALAVWAYQRYAEVCQNPCIDLSPLQDFAPNQTSFVYDVHGTEIGRYLIEDRRVTPFSEMPLELRHAFLAIEDARFYEHDGVDYQRVLGALWANLAAGHTEQGASTITMQLARNTFPGALPARQRTLERKLREARVARDIEQAFPKDTILQHYLNSIYLGHGAYGVAAAARVYFGKDLMRLTVAEGALLAALPQAPSLIDPYRNPGPSLIRRNLVLDRMHRLGWVRESDWLAARAQPVALAPETTADDLRARGTTGAYFIEAVRLELQRELGPALYRGGYLIHTTLDAGLQRTAETVLESQVVALEHGVLGIEPRPRRADARTPRGGAATPYLQAGMIILDPDSGDVRVLIGGRSFEDSPFNRMTQARRQPGSAFKPFVYAAALSAGRKATDSVSDGPVAIVMPAGNTWRPQNYRREERNGIVSLETALAKSLNRATVRLGMSLGVSRVAAAARAMGLEDSLPLRPSMLLGAADLRPIDLIAAYAPLARGDGRAIRPRLVTAVTDAGGRVLLTLAPATRQGLNPTVAAELRDMLTQVVDRGTARSVRQHGMVGPVAGKTGTTNGTTNAWFVGVTPSYVAGVWVGFDRPRAILPDGSATGGRIAAPIWAEVMKRIPQLRDQWPEPPSAVPDSPPAAEDSIPAPVPPIPFPAVPTLSAVDHAPTGAPARETDLPEPTAIP
jgi:1A family penicillin-binding protein